MPSFSFWYFFLILCNFSFPFSGNFTSELIVFSEIIYKNIFVGLIGGLTVFFSAVYSIWYYGRVFNGPPGMIKVYQDVTPKEYSSLVVCVVGVFLLGIYGWEYSAISLEDYCFYLRYLLRG